MITAIWLAVTAAVVVAVFFAVFRRPWAAALLQVRRAAKVASVGDHENAARALDRIAAELAMRRNQEDGNPDDEFYADWYTWFTGDPGVDPSEINARKQDRDLGQASRVRRDR